MFQRRGEQKGRNLKKGIKYKTFKRINQDYLEMKNSKMELEKGGGIKNIAHQNLWVNF